MDDEDNKILDEDEASITLTVGVTSWKNGRGLHILEEDYKVSGEVWRVHKSDPDPLPSNPHAHCIAGAARYVGCKLHLGTRQLYSKANEPLGRFLGEKQFNRLIEMVARKFPDLQFPLAG